MLESCKATVISQDKPVISIASPRKGGAVEDVAEQSQDELNWSELAFELDLDSVARQVALNSIVDSYVDNRLQLAFLPELEVMLKPDLERQIKQAIERKLGVSLTLEFHSMPCLAVETPHQAALRKLEQERQGVIQSIRKDPLVQQLQSVFGAELVENSVKKSG